MCHVAPVSFLFAARGAGADVPALRRLCRASLRAQAVGGRRTRPARRWAHPSDLMRSWKRQSGRWSPPIPVHLAGVRRSKERIRPAPFVTGGTQVRGRPRLTTVVTYCVSPARPGSANDILDVRSVVERHHLDYLELDVRPQRLAVAVIRQPLARIGVYAHGLRVNSRNRMTVASTSKHLEAPVSSRADCLSRPRPHALVPCAELP